MNKLIYHYFSSGGLIPGTRNNLSVREETTTYSYANHHRAGDDLPWRENPCNSMSSNQQPLVPYNGMPPSTLLPLYSQALPSTMPPTTCLSLFSETSPPTLSPMNIPVVTAGITVVPRNIPAIATDIAHHGSFT